jgi:hypothetical protein
MCVAREKFRVTAGNARRRTAKFYGIADELDNCSIR